MCDLPGATKMSLEECCRRVKENDPTLTTLDMSESNIGDRGAIALAFALKKNKTVVELHLGSASVGADGAASLASTLKVNAKLERLYLQSNDIGDKGTEAIAKAIGESSTSTLKLLNLARNGIGCVGAAALAEYLGENTVLHKLYLYDNHIANHGAEALAQLVVNNAALQELFLWDNKIGYEGLEELARALSLADNLHGTKIQLRTAWKVGSAATASSTASSSAAASASASSNNNKNKPNMEEPKRMKMRTTIQLGANSNSGGNIGSGGNSGTVSGRGSNQDKRFVAARYVSSDGRGELNDEEKNKDGCSTSVKSFSSDYAHAFLHAQPPPPPPPTDSAEQALPPPAFAAATRRASMSSMSTQRVAATTAPAPAPTPSRKVIPSAFQWQQQKQQQQQQQQQNHDDDTNTLGGSSSSMASSLQQQHKKSSSANNCKDESRVKAWRNTNSNSNTTATATTTAGNNIFNNVNNEYHTANRRNIMVDTAKPASIRSLHSYNNTCHTANRHNVMMVVDTAKPVSVRSLLSSSEDDHDHDDDDATLGSVSKQKSFSADDCRELLGKSSPVKSWRQKQEATTTTTTSAKTPTSPKTASSSLEQAAVTTAESVVSTSQQPKSFSADNCRELLGNASPVKAWKQKNAATTPMAGVENDNDDDATIESVQSSYSRRGPKKSFSADNCKELLGSSTPVSSMRRKLDGKKILDSMGSASGPACSSSNSSSSSVLNLDHHENEAAIESAIASASALSSLRPKKSFSADDCKEILGKQAIPVKSWKQKQLNESAQNSNNPGELANLIAVKASKMGNTALSSPPKKSFLADDCKERLGQASPVKSWKNKQVNGSAHANDGGLQSMIAAKASKMSSTCTADPVRLSDVFNNSALHKATSVVDCGGSVHSTGSKSWNPTRMKVSQQKLTDIIAARASKIDTVYESPSPVEAPANSSVSKSPLSEGNKDSRGDPVEPNLSAKSSRAKSSSHDEENVTMRQTKTTQISSKSVASEEDHDTGNSVPLSDASKRSNGKAGHHQLCDCSGSVQSSGSRSSWNPNRMNLRQKKMTDNIAARATKTETVCTFSDTGLFNELKRNPADEPTGKGHDAAVPTKQASTTQVTESLEDSKCMSTKQTSSDSPEFIDVAPNDTPGVQPFAESPASLACLQPDHDELNATSKLPSSSQRQPMAQNRKERMPPARTASCRGFTPPANQAQAGLWTSRFAPPTEAKSENDEWESFAPSSEFNVAVRPAGSASNKTRSPDGEIPRTSARKQPKQQSPKAAQRKVRNLSPTNPVSKPVHEAPGPMRAQGQPKARRRASVASSSSVDLVSKPAAVQHGQRHAREKSPVDFRRDQGPSTEGPRPMRAQGQQKPLRRASLSVSASAPVDCRRTLSPVDSSTSKLKLKPMHSPVQKKTRPPPEKQGSPRRELSAPRAGMKVAQVIAVDHKGNRVYEDPPEEKKEGSPDPAPKKRAAAAAAHRLDTSTCHDSPTSTRSTATRNGKSKLSTKLQKQQLKHEGQSLKNRGDIDRERQSCHGKVMNSGHDAGKPKRGMSPLKKKKSLRKNRVEGIVGPVSK